LASTDTWPDMQQTTDLITTKAPSGGLPVVCQPHAFSSAYSTGITPQGRNIREILEALELPLVVQQYVRVWVDDYEVPAEYWGRVKPKEGRTVYVRVMAHGGGGNKMLRTVLSIAIAVAAVATGQYYAAEMGFTTLNAAGATVLTTTGQVVAATITVGVNMLGNMALNALIPPQLPTSPEFGSMGSPRYQLTGTQNRFEPYATIPRVFGKRRMYPLMAARPYSETQGNDEYLRIALVVGWGPVRITDIRIGETPITAYEGVEYEVREGWDTDAPLTKFTQTVTEQQFSVLLEKPTESAANWSTRTTDTNTNEIILDLSLPSGLAYFNDSGGRDSISVTFEVQYRQVGTVNFSSPTWLSAETGFETPGLITVSAADTSAVRVSGRFLPGGTAQWEVRVRKTTTERGSRYVEAAYWTVLRSIQPSNPIQQTGLALIAIRMKASGQLNGVPNTINCLAESYLPVYNGSTWSWAISRNPAWAYAHALRYRGPEQIIPDSRIDLAAITAWATACAATAPNASEPRWCFDGVIEGGSVFSALRQIAAHARATFTVRDGKYSIVREVEQTVPVQHITPRNSSGYQGTKQFLDYPHALRVQFVNAAANFQEDEVIVYDDGYNASNASKFESLELPGCTSASQAWREGRYLIAAGRLRPEEHVVNMDIESVRCTQGDLVRFSHDAISIGLASTRIRTMTLNVGSITEIFLEDQVQFEAGKNYALRVRNAFGTSTVISVLNPGNTITDQVTVTSLLGYVGSGIRDGDLVMFGESSLESAPMIVKRIENGPDFTARLTLVDAQSGIYTADSGSIPAFSSFISVQTPIEQVRPSTPSIANVRSNETVLLRLSDGTLQDRIAIDMNSPAASFSAVETYETQWRAVGERSWAVQSTAKDSPIYLSPVLSGKQYEFRIRAVSRYGAASDYTATTTHLVIGKTTPPSAVGSMTATLDGGQILLSWAAVPDLDLSEYEVRYGTTWNTATSVGRVRSTTLRVAPAALGTLTWLVKAVDSIGLLSTTATSASYTLTGPLAPTPQSSFSSDQVVLRWSAPVSLLPIDSYGVGIFGTFSQSGTSVTVTINDHRYAVGGVVEIDFLTGSDSATPTDGIYTITAKTANTFTFTVTGSFTRTGTLLVAIGTIKATTFSTKANWGGSRTFCVRAIDANKNLGSIGTVEANVALAQAPAITTQVVDNNVLLYWNDVVGSLPTQTYEIRKGATWAGGTVIGTKSGIFTSVFEVVSGTYTYWIAAVDTAGNYGTAGSVSTKVNQPPDYVLKIDSFSAFGGTKSNMAASGDGGWLLPVNTSETYQAHFTSRSWTTPQNQVDAGFPLFIQPTVTTGYYEEIIDLGASVAGSKVSLAVNGSTVSGTITVTTKLSISPDNSTWTDFDNVTSIFGSNFRYVKYRVTVTGGSTTSVYRISGLNLRVDSKLINDAGNATCNAADAGGTVVNFNTPFVDVVSIEVTPKGTSPVIAMYDFTDVPNPTSFKILLFSTSGTRVSGDVSWSVKGY
jgi:predicted phage tail protein